MSVLVPAKPTELSEKTMEQLRECNKLYEVYRQAVRGWESVPLGADSLLERMHHIMVAAKTEYLAALDAHYELLRGEDGDNF